MAPKPAAGSPRTKAIAFRVLLAEEARYRVAAQKEKLTLSDWLRKIADKAS